MSGKSASRRRTACATIAWSSTRKTIVEYSRVGGPDAITRVSGLSITLTPDLSARTCDQLNQFVGNLIQGKDFHRGIQLRGCFRHAVDRATGRILGNGQRSRVAHRLEAPSPVPAHTGKQDPGGFPVPVTHRAF